MRAPKTKVPDYPGKKAAEAALGPLVEPLARKMAATVIQRLTGFWTIWHVYGGDSPRVQRETGLSRSSVYRSRDEFARVFGVDVEDWHPEIAAMLRVIGPDFYRVHGAAATTELRVTAGGNVEEVPRG